MLPTTHEQAEMIGLWPQEESPVHVVPTRTFVVSNIGLTDTTARSPIEFYEDQTAFQLERVTDPLEHGAFEVSHTSYTWLTHRLEGEPAPNDRLVALFADND